VRKIAEDIGDILKCGAHMTKILRLSIGPFKLEDAVNPESVDDKSLQKFSV
jgi:tRNA pseudouridine55 synthase